jgi:predicted ATPase
LLTITGSGGCGKRRLAFEVARAQVDHFADGVWRVELAPLADASLVTQTIATTLGIRDDASRPLLDVLTESLRRRQALLILDNCEHVIDVCAQSSRSLRRLQEIRGSDLCFSLTTTVHAPPPGGRSKYSDNDRPQ